MEITIWNVFNLTEIYGVLGLLEGESPQSFLRAQNPKLSYSNLT